ncbi:carotenoid oxygenase family protein [Streptomyces sp. NPDC059169]|uniref:carotenoid oxygenase family protein n=1 Tax=Streptomyces sp. NPDC059169 TaxID=3346754 RepID=UPI0036806C4F
MTSNEARTSRPAAGPLSATTDQATPPHLLGNYAPVPDELTVTELPVTGAVPPELSGWYLRNGPNPHEAPSRHWFLGSGMVHGVRLDGGRATAYRNRWVRTSSFTDGAQMHGPDGRLDLTAGHANTHVVRHAGRTFALVEASYPYELDMRPGCELGTVGAYDFGGRLHTPMTAHPKTCPTTGELHFFGYGTVGAPPLTYHRADADGKLTVSRPVEVAAPTMMHDFQLTERHVVFLDLPMVFDLELAVSGATGLPFRWSPQEYGARLGVLRRDDPYGEVRWFEIEPCYVFHTVNAHEEDDRLVLHAMRYPDMSDGTLLAASATLWRWTADLAAGTVREEQLDDRAAEFPRIDDRLAGRNARFGHVTADADPVGRAGAALHRYDLRSGGATSHVFGPGRTPGEAVFVPADDSPGGAGWLMTFVHDAATDRSDLVILDADRLAEAPVATVHLPRRVPFGFHGSWLPDLG